MDAKNGIKRGARAILRAVQSLFLQLIRKGGRIVRHEDSESLKSRLMIGLVPVTRFMLISGWNLIIEPMVLHG